MWRSPEKLLKPAAALKALGRRGKGALLLLLLVREDHRGNDWNICMAAGGSPGGSRGVGSCEAVLGQP